MPVLECLEWWDGSAVVRVDYGPLKSPVLDQLAVQSTIARVINILENISFKEVTNLIAHRTSNRRPYNIGLDALPPLVATLRVKVWAILSKPESEARVNKRCILKIVYAWSWALHRTVYVYFTSTSIQKYALAKPCLTGPRMPVHDMTLHCDSGL